MKHICSVGLVLAFFMSITLSGVSGATSFKVGLVTNSSTVDDKSFNQGTWEGIQRASKQFKLETKYLRPGGSTEADFLKEIGNLYDAGFKLIVCPGFPFETAIFQAQKKYLDAKFVLIDGMPHSGDNQSIVGKNTVSILFAEHEAGFLAGVATALQLKEGAAGFIGGMELPQVQSFNWGFQQGIQYANNKYGTQIAIKSENVIYQGSFNNVAAGQQISSQMYEHGVKVIFCAAGGVGIGCINEAKSRTLAGKDVWVVGVDRDQYWDGIYEGNKSVVLTSAVKRVDQAAYAMVKALKENQFPGGKVLTFNAKSNGVGIPEKNPNLTKEVQDKVTQILGKLKSGEIKVFNQQGNLIP